MNIPLDEVIYIDEITVTPATGAAVDADSAPTFAVYEEATDTAIVTGTYTKRTSLTGNYRATFTLSAANGFELGKWYSCVSSAIVGGVTGKKVSKNFRVVAAELVAGYPPVDLAKVLGVTATTSDGTAQAGAATTITLASGDTGVANCYVGRTITITGGTGIGQARLITAYNSTTKVATVATWGTNPDSTSTYTIGDTADANVLQISGDTTAADNAEGFFDGTGYNGANNLIGTVTNLNNVNGIASPVLDQIGAAVLGFNYATAAAINGGFVFEVADLFASVFEEIDNINQSASRRMTLDVVPQFERPESGNVTYTVELRTYDADGSLVSADSTPTLTATGVTSGSLAANLSAATQSTTGVYTYTYTVASTATLEQITFAAAATIAGDGQTLTRRTAVADFVAATFTTADRTTLQAAATATALATAQTAITAIGAKTTNLPAAPAAVGDIPTAAANATAVMASTAADGVALSTLLTAVYAAARGVVTVTGTGPYTYSFKKADGTTQAFTITYNTATGARS